MKYKGKTFICVVFHKNLFQCVWLFLQVKMIEKISTWKWILMLNIFHLLLLQMFPTTKRSLKTGNYPEKK